MTISQAITELSEAPQRNTDTESQFNTKADTRMSEENILTLEINTWAGQANSTATDVNTDALAAAQSVTDAAAQVTLAAGQVTLAEDQVVLATAEADRAEDAANAADNASNATLYDTGIVGGYAVGDVVYSATGQSYRCIQIQAQGSVEPLTNTAYWTQLGGITDLVEDPAPQLGGTLDANSNPINMGDAVISRPKLIDVSETLNALGDLAGGTDTIDLELGNVVTATVSTAAQTLTFTNPPATGSNGSFVLFLTNGGSQTITWPTSVDWVAATAPTLTAAGLDILVFTTNDAGTTWMGLIAGLDVK